MIRGHFLRTVSYLPHVKEPVMKGHLSCRDTFSWILRCPLKTGCTVPWYQVTYFLWSLIFSDVVGDYGSSHLGYHAMINCGLHTVLSLS